MWFFPRDTRPAILMILSVSLVMFAGVSITFQALDAFDWFYEYSRDHEDWELDELALIGFAFLVALGFCGMALVMVLNRSLRRQVAETERARGEAESHAARAERAEAARARFLSNMSHEMRTPLNAIGGFSDLLLQDLEEGAPAEESVKYARSIQKAGRSLTDLVADVLDLTDLETRDGGLALAPLSLPSVLEDVRRELVPSLSSRGNKLVVRLQDLPEKVESDEGYLARALRNLILELGQEAEGTDIRCQGEAGSNREARLTILADGLDWSEARLQELTLLLGHGRGEARTPRKGPGTGVGVPLARGFLAAMGGRLEILRADDGACGFRVTLPV